MLERDIERAIADEAGRLGLVAWKLTVPGRRGVPDRMFIGRDGRVAFLEVKAPGRRPRALQLQAIRDLKRRGFAAGWVDSAEAGREFLLEWLADC